MAIVLGGGQLVHQGRALEGKAVEEHRADLLGPRKSEGRPLQELAG